MPILPPSQFFPPAEEAGPEGLVGVGGRLTPAWLLDAYRHGIFPWPSGEPDQMVPWVSPEPRAIIELDGFHVPKRLMRTCRSGQFGVTVNRDFDGVIRGCATAGPRRGHTWLIPPMIRAYSRLFQLGHAHSVEVWLENQLAGGLYGVSIGGFFSAESMFHRTEASKVALVHLVSRLRERGYALLDIQQLSPHTARFGAVEIPRRDYLTRLGAALEQPATFGEAGESELGLGT